MGEGTTKGTGTNDGKGLPDDVVGTGHHADRFQPRILFPRTSGTREGRRCTAYIIEGTGF